MQNKMACIIEYVHIVWIAVLLLEISCHATESMPQLSELIEKYAETLDSVQSIISSYESSSISSVYLPPLNLNFRNEKFYMRGQRRTDGKGRIYDQRYRWGYVSQQRPDVPKESATYSLMVSTPDLQYAHSKNACGPAPDGLLTYLDYQGLGEDSFINETDAFFLGYIGNDSRVDVNLKNAKQISVQPEPEIINGSVCYVVQADTAYGDYTLWLDSAHGFQPAKIERSTGKGDIIGITKHRPPPDKRVEGETSLVIDDIKFKMVQGVWVPVEGRVKRNIEWVDGFFKKDEIHFKNTEIVLSPDHDALHSFANPMKNPKLDPELVNGTMVRVGRDRLDCIWRDGRIFDSYGHEVDIDTLEPTSVDPEELEPASLVGEHLPELVQFSIRLEPKWTENKKILVCFWDMSQRPSRNCVQTLNKRAQMLLKKNIYIVFVHAEEIKRMKLDAWVKENRIGPPVGVSRSRLSGLRQSWGVQSMPWLILTDKEHVVRAEGFALDELDEKIKELSEI